MADVKSYEAQSRSGIAEAAPVNGETGDPGRFCGQPYRLCGPVFEYLVASSNHYSDSLLRSLRAIFVL